MAEETFGPVITAVKNTPSKDIKVNLVILIKKAKNLKTEIMGGGH